MSLRLTFDIEEVWPDVAQLLEKVIPYAHEEFTVEDIKKNLLEYSNNLVLYEEENKIIGIVIFSTSNIADKKTAFIIAASGRTITSKEHWKDLKELLKTHGYVYIEAAMRDTAFRLFSSLGFKKKYNIAGVNI